MNLNNINTMTRDTSIKAYQEITKNGLLSKKRLEVYQTVYNNGPLTSAESYMIMNKDKPKTAVISQSRARFTELRDMGCLKELGARTCKITGKTAILWDVTSALPSDIPSKKTKKQKKEEVLELMRELAETLEEYNKSKLRYIYKKIKNI